MTSVQLAQASNAAVYATMVTLAIAMVFFAVSFAAGRRRTPVAASATAVVEGAGGAAVITRPPEVTDAPVEPGRRAANIGMSLTWLAFLLLLAGVVLRGVWAGRAPWGNMYEFSITAALGVLGVFLVMSLAPRPALAGPVRRHPDAAAGSAWPSPSSTPRPPSWCPR